MGLAPFDIAQLPCITYAGLALKLSESVIIQTILRGTHSGSSEEKHKERLTAAIYACEPKTTTAKALTAMYMLDNQGRPIDPGATEDGACENLVDGLMRDIGGIQPAKAALAALLLMGPPERTQGWLPPKFEHGMRLLGEPLKKIRTFQAHVVRLAMEAGMWVTRCRVVHPNGTRGLALGQQCLLTFAVLAT